MPKYLIATTQTHYTVVETDNEDMEEVAELFLSGERDLMEVQLVTASQIDVDIAELHHPDSFETMLGEVGGLP